MRLTRWQRVALAIVGTALLSAGGVGAALDWSGVGLTGFIVAGVFVLLGAVVGAMPKGSFKEGNVEWPDVDKHPRIEQLEAEVAALRAEVATDTAALRGELTTARTSSNRTANLLIDYLLAQEPDPDDGMTNEERLHDLKSNIQELQSDISHRYFVEQDDDGINVKDLEECLDRNCKALAREERRQGARARFKLNASSSIDD